jgi:hypothetical protein
MSGGKRGLIENSTNLCTSTNNVHIEFAAQNGKTLNQVTPLTPECPKHKKHKSGKHHKKKKH